MHAIWCFKPECVTSAVILLLAFEQIIFFCASRNFAAKSDGPPRGSVSDSDDYVEKNQGWFSRLLPVRKIDPGSESHSSLLADKETVYEMQS